MLLFNNLTAYLVAETLSELRQESSERKPLLWAFRPLDPLTLSGVGPHPLIRRMSLPVLYKYQSISTSRRAVSNQDQRTSQHLQRTTKRTITTTEDGACCLYRPCSRRLARRLVLEALPLVDPRHCADLTGDSIENSPIGRLANPRRLDGRLYWELSDWLANGATPLDNENWLASLLY